MTTQSVTETPASQNRHSFWLFVERLPGATLLKNLNIGRKLTIGFGLLVAITLIGAGFSYLGSIPANQTISRTQTVRVPVALDSARAQANLLKMLGDVRGYLALGEGEYRISYQQGRDAFEKNLADLETHKSFLNAENQARVDELQQAFEEWSELPEQLFDLRDDQLEREPAYELLATDGILLGGQVLIDLGELIDSQGRREATPDNIALLADMANFQGSFAAMLSGLRGYVTTRNRTFKGEYEANLTINQFAWERLSAQRAALTPEQQGILDSIAQNREAFLLLPEQMFALLESEEWRRDLYLFRTEAVPRTAKMQQLLAAMTVDQQNLLQTELNNGINALERSNQQTLTGGILALIIGVGLAFVFRENIAGPVRRLTGVAEQIRAGDLEARATVESKDEIGALASTFNSMTGQLQGTLIQVRKEKKRADDLLEVVIPIGIELSAEKDFNRLLEKILLEAKSFCHANAGMLYLLTTEDNQLRPVIVRNDLQNLALGGTTNKEIHFPPIPLYDGADEPNNHNVAADVALTGQPVNIANTSNTVKYDFSDLESGQEKFSYQAATSVLTIPLKNSHSQVLGVLQLLDAREPETRQVIPFDQNLQQMMESLSSLAAAALEAYIREQSLRQEIKQLRIEIDETKRKQQVSEIVESDFFADLQARAKEIRKRGRRRGQDKPDADSPSEDD